MNFLFRLPVMRLKAPECVFINEDANNIEFEDERDDKNFQLIVTKVTPNCLETLLEEKKTLVSKPR